MRIIAFALLFSQIAIFTNSVLQDRPEDNAADVIMIAYCFSLMASALYLLMS
jgi:hypothetical protein